MSEHKCAEGGCLYHGRPSPRGCGCHQTDEQVLRKRLNAALAVLDEARRAIGEHYAPDDCYATGPLTGDPIRDLVQCPACSFIAMHDEYTKAHPTEGARS